MLGRIFYHYLRVKPQALRMMRSVRIFKTVYVASPESSLQYAQVYNWVLSLTADIQPVLANTESQATAIKKKSFSPYSEMQ